MQTIQASSKFNIGQQVASRQTGFPGVGTVIAILPYYMWVKYQKTQRSQRWLSLYPDYEAKNITIVQYTEPRRPLTYDEFRSQMNSEDVPVAFYQSVYNQIAAEYIIAYPEDDLELV